jgi:hypothetical protein
MRRLSPSIVGLIVLTALTVRTFGAEPSLSTSELLAKWEAASKKRPATNVAFTRIVYGEQFGYSGRLNKAVGLFFCDSSNTGFYKIDDQRLVVWDKEALTVVNYPDKNYVRWSQADIALARRRWDELEHAAWHYCLERISLYPLFFSEPEDVLPLCGRIDAKTIQQRFDVSWRGEEGAIFVTARPKTRRDAARFRQIDVQLSPDKMEPLAHRWINPKEPSTGSQTWESVVHIFKAIKEDAPPADLDRLTHPNLDGFQIDPLAPARNSAGKGD